MSDPIVESRESELQDLKTELAVTISQWKEAAAKVDQLRDELDAAKRTGQTKAGYTCGTCERKFDLVEVGIVLITYFNQPPEPYEMWEADLHKCPNCHRTAVLGVADNPFSIHFQEDFNEQLRQVQDSGRTIVRQYERNHGAARYQAGPEEGEICPKT